ncbi:MAG: universal stress protein [Paracoccaceae bacterium]
MTRHILVATDGSEAASRAVETAAELAAKLGAKLTVGHVLMHREPPEGLEHMAEVEHMVKQTSHAALSPAPDDMPGTMTTLFKASEDAAHTARIVAALGDSIVTHAAERARKIGATDVDTRVANGDYAEAILDIAKSEGADMIVLGRRGLGRFKRLLQGSVSNKIISHADCAVLTVV